MRAKRSDVSLRGIRNERSPFVVPDTNENGIAAAKIIGLDELQAIGQVAEFIREHLEKDDPGGRGDPGSESRDVPRDLQVAGEAGSEGSSGEEDR